MKPSISCGMRQKNVPLPGVWAIVVSYCGGEQLFKTISALLNQVDHIHIVDNASTKLSLQVLQQLAAMPDISVSLLPKNMGIGYALNRGVERAHEAGAQWVLSMDQDSTADKGLLQAYAKALNHAPELVCLAPNILNHGLGKKKRDADLDFAITSGNLVKINLLNHIGGFDEDLFIDGVDIDLSLRIRLTGAHIRRIEAAVLYHELGRKHLAKGMLAKFYTVHSPLRRYYMYRNHLLLLRRHALRFPLFMIKATVFQCLHLVAVVRYEGINGASLLSIWAGVKAGLAGRIGTHS